MKIKKKHIIYIFCTCIMILFAFYIAYINVNNKYIDKYINTFFKNTIYTYLSSAKNNTFFAITNYTHDPKDIGKYVEKKMQVADTILTYKSKIVDHDTHIYRTIQTLMLGTNKLSPNIINHIFDSICYSKDIYANTSVAITADFYKKVNLLSRDTTQMNIKFRTGIYNQGEFEDINYYAYLQTTPYTHWKLMPKVPMVISVVVFLILFLIARLYFSRRNKKIAISAETTSSTETTEAISFSNENNPLRLTKQQQTLYLMFLKSPDRCVKKELIKNTLWPKNQDKTSNMTTAVKRLKDSLEKNTPYTINTFAQDESYYIMEERKEYVNSDTSQKM